MDFAATVSSSRVSKGRLLRACAVNLTFFEERFRELSLRAKKRVALRFEVRPVEVKRKN